MKGNSTTYVFDLKHPDNSNRTTAECLLENHINATVGNMQLLMKMGGISFTEYVKWKDDFFNDLEDKFCKKG